MKRTRIIALTLCTALCGAGAVLGQGPGNGPSGQGGPGGQGKNRPPPPPPLPPVIQALDTNHDGIIEADEIENAAQSLKTLLKSGSNQLTIEDLLGPPRHGRRPHGPGKPNASGSNTQGGQNGTQGQCEQDGPPPGPPPGETGPGGPGTPDGHHPPGPLFQALDTNHDGILEADEIANAAQSLKKLETANGEITPKDLRPPPPPDGQAPPPPPSQSGTNGQNGGAGQPPPPPE